jgi:hypothetical protein
VFCKTRNVGFFTSLGVEVGLIKVYLDFVWHKILSGVLASSPADW